jgi:creatinine amidohydrolase
MYAQQLPTNWEDLTASDFVLAVEKSQGVAIIPMGVLEKHGQHLPLGTDVFIARDMVRRAVEQEYAVVFPFYFAGQIFEAKQQPGTIAYSTELIYKLLDETCREIARNGFKKIILVNAHGGNNAFLQYFTQVQLESPRDYVVYFIRPPVDSETQRKINEMSKSAIQDGHGGEVETSAVLAIRPDLVKMERANDESGEDLSRLPLKKQFPAVQTGIWWYAQFPNHYSGDGKYASVELGELFLESRAKGLANLIRAIKADEDALRLQNEFFRESERPLETRARK